jgi:hypothetical protein
VLTADGAELVGEVLVVVPSVEAADGVLPVAVVPVELVPVDVVLAVPPDSVAIRIPRPRNRAADAEATRTRILLTRSRRARARSAIGSSGGWGV